VGAGAALDCGDFFDRQPNPVFDAVVGNPPYVRYQSFAGEAREKGARAALAQGVRVTGLASSWAPFVVHAAAFLKPAGRLALVLPAELLSVNYAAAVRRFLMQRFGSVKLILFEERTFPGVSEEVVLLLAEGTGPTDHCELHQAQNLEDLANLRWHRWSPDGQDKWLSALIPQGAAQNYKTLVESDAFTPLKDWGDTSLGMVTGNNRFFCLSASEASELGLRKKDLLRISPPGSRHLRGLTFSEKAWREMRDLGARVYLFRPDQRQLSAASKVYIASGEASGVQDAYKCRVRSPWWKVPRVPAPDLFLTYMNHDAPRLVTNEAGVECLNSIHCVYLKDRNRAIGTALLPISMLNSVTLLGAELCGRSYGGGMLKLEPREADLWPVPSESTLRDVESELESLRPQLALHLRNGDLAKVVNLVDRVLLTGHLKTRKSQLDSIRDARRAMFDRRLARSRTRGE